MLAASTGRAVAAAAVLLLGGLTGGAASVIVVSAASACSSSFTVVPSTNPGNAGNVLTGVAAIGGSDIWAVGYQQQTATGGTATNTLFEHWDGTSWSTVPGGNTSGHPSVLSTAGQLTGVGGSGTSDVWAVGKAALIEHWDGTTWGVIAAAAGTGDLSGVWADSPTDAWAVGTQSSGSTTTGVTEHWNGTAWQAVPGQDSSRLGWTSVSGSGPGDVWAYGPNNAFLAAEHWNGAGWTSNPPDFHTTGPNPLDAGGIADMGAGGTFIAASQQAIPGNSRGSASFQKWNGSAWTALGTVYPPDVTGYTMTSTAASAANDVWFVGLINRANPGDPQGSNQPPEPYAEHFDGTQLTVVSSAEPTNPSEYNGVTAVSGQAWAVGSGVDPTTHQSNTLIETACIAAPGTAVPEAPSGAVLGAAGLLGLAVAYSGMRRRAHGGAVPSA